MSVWSSLGAGLALLAAGVFVSGCDRGGGAAPGVVASGSSSSAAPNADPAVAAQKAACAAFRDAVESTNTANQTFFKAVEDPLRGGVDYDKPMTDAANAAAVIFVYGADQIDGAVTPQVPKDLASKFGDFVQILHERARLYAQHAGSDKLDPNGDKYTPAANDLLKACPAGSSDAVPPKLAAVPASSPDTAKQGFCEVYSKQIQQADDAKERFAAATRGDDRRPRPQWKDPDQWLAGQAADAGIVFKYAANLIEAQLAPQLSADVADKGRTLVTAMRKLSKLYIEQAGTDERNAVFNGDYSSSADAIDAACGIQ
ncbi:hypothetical protein Srot_2711 [Segniliparus rotundus DSM 44985]|uniref:Uncharacterized protein n=1 Tax=Segniliparus rotundus (strain ATCC BAA-972 / CDC 1076 / CIP 108378 / DSM 44985 / JCM 13578) TaxID=640132 RepID=D6ZCV8_SEGRD|nr:hypothetical protein [Segniliparus rotundus]ADG99145.1 hypothetical protein Srot_2711 [Segniliparus rotundus DSM 44985]